MAFGIDDAIAAGLQVLNKFVPDPAAKAQAEAELRSSLQLWDKAQTDVNAVEAANPNIFVSGWRPFIAWVCGVALAFNYLTPYIGWLVASVFHQLIPMPPKLDGSLTELVTAMLGLAGMRSWEKYKGLAK
jgi:Holin of 3TMs, for gene-transfer release